MFGHHSLLNGCHKFQKVTSVHFILKYDSSALSYSSYVSTLRVDTLFSYLIYYIFLQSQKKPGSNILQAASQIYGHRLNKTHLFSRQKISVTAPQLHENTQKKAVARTINNQVTPWTTARAHNVATSNDSSFAAHNHLTRPRISIEHCRTWNLDRGDKEYNQNGKHALPAPQGCTFLPGTDVIKPKEPL